jgi:hypothetical protein
MVNFDRILSSLKEVTAKHASSSDDDSEDGQADAASAKGKANQVRGSTHDNIRGA